MKAGSFEDLVVWQKAHKLVLSIYQVSRLFPREEIYCLTAQLRRAAISVPSNIVEGFNRRGKADKLKFYNYAESSLEEARYQLILAADLGFADTTEVQSSCRNVSALLSSYIRQIKTP